jgi:hypothetical protein
MIARLMRDSTVPHVACRREGWTRPPPDQATVRPAIQQSGNGETYDFEFTPTTPGALLTMSSGVGVLLVSMPIPVR